MPYNTCIINFKIGLFQEVFGEFSFYDFIVKPMIRDARFHFNYKINFDCAHYVSFLCKMCLQFIRLF